MIIEIKGFYRDEDELAFWQREGMIEEFLANGQKFKCKDCQEFKSPDEFRFRSDKTAFMKSCRSCENKNNLEHHHKTKNDPKKKAKKKIYEKSMHRKKLRRISAKKRYEANPEPVIARSKKYRKNNSEKITIKNKKKWQIVKNAKWFAKLDKKNIIEHLKLKGIFDDVCKQTLLPAKFLMKYGVNEYQFARLINYLRIGYGKI